MDRGRALSLYINFARLLVERDRRIYREITMTKLQNLADRAPKIMADLEARAGTLDERLSKIEAKGHGAFDKWDGHLDAQEKAIAVAENAINQLSNSPPLEDSPPEPQFQQPGAGNGAAPNTSSE
jgi:hypothetical protein